MTMKLGTELTPAQQKEACARCVYRFAGTHRPAWAHHARPDGTAYPLQFADDADWLAHTRFAVTASGALDMRARFCQSSPTWPNNPELRK